MYMLLAKNLLIYEQKVGLICLLKGKNISFHIFL